MGRNEVHRSQDVGQPMVSPRSRGRRGALVKAMPLGLGISAIVFQFSAPALAADGDWAVDALGNWTTPGNWSPGLPDGIGEVAGLTFDITAGRTVTIDTTSRTVGTLNIGDPTTAFGIYTLAASGGASLILNNGGTGVTIAKTTSGNNVQDVISAPLSLADNLSINITEATVPTASTNLQFTGVISEVGGVRTITKTGSGLARLDGASTFTGGVIVNAGDLQVGNSSTPTSGAVTSGPLGRGTLTMNGGSITARGAGRTLANAVTVGANFTLNSTFGGGNTMTLSGPVDLGGSVRTITIGTTSGAGVLSGVVYNGGITKAGTRPLTLSGTNTYAGGTTITNGGGMIVITSGAALGTGAINIASGGSDVTARLQISGGITVPNAINMAGAITGTNSRIENASGTNTLTGASMFYTTGGALNPIGSTSGTLNITGNMTASSVTGIRNFAFFGAGDISASGTISNGSATVGVNKDGAGTLTLSPAAGNTYSGGTNINVGALIASADGALGTGNVSVLGTSLTLTGGTTNNYINNAATLTVGPTSTVALTYTGTDVINMLVFDGVTQGPGVYSAGTSSFLTGTGTLTVLVPEPASMGLLAAGALGLLSRRRRCLRH